MTYKVVRDSEGDAVCFGPNDDNYVPTIAAGHTLNIEESLPTITQIPQEVTALQGLLALDAAGLSGAYDTWATSVSRTFAEKAFINKSVTWRRNSETIAAACTALGITEQQRDALFVLAATL